MNIKYKKYKKQISINKNKILGAKSKVQRKNNINSIKIRKSSIVTDNNLYNTVFEKIDSLIIEEIHDVITNKYSLDDIEITLKKSSNPLQQVKNYIGSNPLTHIPRKQTYEIYTWIKDDLKNDSKNILILTGEKGVGKSVIMKDLYDILTNECNFVLGIKADKYYYSNITELEKNIFLNSLTFEILLNSFKNKNEKLGRIKHKNPNISNTGKIGTTNMFVIKKDKDT